MSADFPTFRLSTFRMNIRSIASFAREVLREYSKNNGSLAAAAVSYFIFLSMIPMLLVAVAAGAYLLGSTQRAQQLALSYLAAYAPAFANPKNPHITEFVEQLIRGRGAATGIGLAAVVWSGTSAIAQLERAINLAWGTGRQRPFVRARLVSFGMLLVMGALLGASFVVTSAINAIKSLDIHLLGRGPESVPWFWGMLAYLVPLLVTIGAFTAAYKILPNTRVAFRVALVGGVFAGVLWEITKHLFTYYALHFANYSRVYGPLADIILLLVWIYYSSTVTILGAEVAATWEGKSKV